jgi:hypothetical protein
MGQHQNHRSNLVTALGACLMVIILLVIMIFYLILTLPPAPQIPEQPELKGAAEKVEFQRLLAKHGLQYDVSIVYEDHLGRYFIRDGRRCAFK